MNIATLFSLLGGLALFLFGMQMMSDGLQKAAGEKMRYILGLLTRNPVMGVLAGAVTTMVLQSSSATTVMVIGFVSAGLMTLPQAISIILGANIGTTITAQIIAFHISDYIFPIVFIGFLIGFAARREVLKNIGNTVLGFGILFIGIETMGAAMAPLAESPAFAAAIEKVADFPVLGLLLGTVMTVVVQSSSAVIAVLQNVASQAGPGGTESVLGLTGAIPILLGSNIGTTITALLACIGQTREAKRTAVAHSVFNISGSLVFIFFINWFAQTVQLISPAGNELDVIAREIANAHTVFNVVSTILWLPLIRLMVKIVMWILPEKEKEEKGQRSVTTRGMQRVDANVVNQPLFALHLVSKRIYSYTEILVNLLANVRSAILGHSMKKLKRADQAAGEAVAQHGDIHRYLLALFSSGSMNEEQAAHATELMYILEDLGRISKCMQELFAIAKEKQGKDYEFSGKAMEEIGQSFDLVEKMYLESVRAVMYGGEESAFRLEKYRRQLTKQKKTVRKNHKRRIRDKKCRPELTESFTNIFHSMERLGEGCSSIAESAAEDMFLKYLPADCRRG